MPDFLNQIRGEPNDHSEGKRIVSGDEAESLLDRRRSRRRGRGSVTGTRHGGASSWSAGRSDGLGDRRVALGTSADSSAGAATAAEL